MLRTGPSAAPDAGSETRNHLPVQLTRVFGRDSDVADLADILPGSRLVTLTGAPGAGKSRLAVEVGLRLRRSYADGVRLVDLSSVEEPAHVAAAIASALGLRERPGRSIEDTLVEELAQCGAGNVLLIVDNCEHVVDAAADVAALLVGSCPSVWVLATSRVPFGIPGEQVWHVSPIALDAAVELFIDRARLGSIDFAVDDAGRATIEDICHRLDRLPLAVELAAGWTRMLSAAQILDRLDQPLSPLRGGPRGTTSRQETMEAAVDWSYQLLESAEQELFNRLSVFAGGFDLVAAEVIAGSEHDLLGELTALVDHSLVVTEPTDDDGMRYRMLQPVRQYGRVRLDDRGETELVRRRHAEHYVERVRRADVDWRRPGLGLETFHRLARDEGNLRAALEWAGDNRSDIGLRLAANLAQFWELRGRVNEGRAWLEAALRLTTDDARLRASALHRAGRLAWRQRDYGQARAWIEESLAIVRAQGDSLAIARRLRALALVILSEGDAGTAVGLAEESIDIFRAHEDLAGRLWSLTICGLARYVDGDVAGGDGNIHEALELNHRLGILYATAYGHMSLSYGSNVRGDVTSERQHLCRTLAAMREMGGPIEEPDWLWGGTALALSEGRLHSALRLAGAARALTERSGGHLLEPLQVPVQRRLDRARAKLGRATAARLTADGARRSLDELMDEIEAESDRTGDELDPLSPRERDVAELVARGLTNGEIAEKLFISKRTVETHIEHIKQKLGHDSRTQIMAWALRELTEGEGSVA
jgi:predicted ATPase/DNA-binding CsgD family transcriptional regulator